MKSVYGYIRVSTETQADKGYGLETQRNAIIDYCNKNDLELLNIYSDEGISGAMGDNDDISKRQGLVDLLDILNGTNTIVVMNTSRLWRDDAAKVYITRSVRKLNGDIISIEQPKYSLYSKDPQDFIYNSLMEMLDEYERLTINMKLAKGRSTKAHKGDKPAGKLPYGYEYSKDKKHVIINEKEKETVTNIFTMYVNNISYQQIADILNSDNIKTRGNNIWTKSTLYNMINNDFYIGILTHVDKVRGNHTAIISKELWEKAHNKNKEIN